MRQSTALLFLLVPLLLHAQNYVEASGQTVVFNLAAGAKAAWDKNASEVNMPRGVNAGSRAVSLVGKVRQGRLSCFVSGNVPFTRAMLAVYSLDGARIGRVDALAGKTVTFGKVLSRGCYLIHLESNGMPIASTNILVAR